MPALTAQAAAAHPGLRITAARPIGPEAQLLSILDRRLRDALRVRRVCELDALVFAAAGSTDVRSNALVARRARQWATHHRLPCVVVLRRRVRSEHGRGHPVAARPGPAAHRRRQLVPRARGCSGPTRPSWPYEAGAVAVSAPMGGEPEIAEVALTRYVVAAMDLVAVDEPLEDLADFEPVPAAPPSVVGA